MCIDYSLIMSLLEPLQTNTIENTGGPVVVTPSVNTKVVGSNSVTH